MTDLEWAMLALIIIQSIWLLKLRKYRKALDEIAGDLDKTPEEVALSSNPIEALESDIILARITLYGD